VKLIVLENNRGIASYGIAIMRRRSRRTLIFVLDVELICNL